MGCKICGEATSGKSSYCKEHKAIAREKWLEKVKAEADTRADKYARFEALYRKAQKAGWDAWQEKTPVPMVVEEHANILDDNSPVVYREVVGGGVCGYACVSVKPGNSSFGRWLVKQGYGGTDSYYGGVTVRMDYFSQVNSPLVQSYEKACAYAGAFCKAINDADIGASAYVRSHID